MSIINLNNGHTPRSPGGVFGGMTEYRECKRLISALSEEMRSLDPDVRIRLTEGTEGITDTDEDSMLFVFHKGTHLKNERGSGAEVIVGGDAPADVQNDAYRLLLSVCGDRGFRYRGVHTLTKKSPFKTFSEHAPQRAFIIKAGYIDSEADNVISERELTALACRLSQTIVNIYKENKNEDYS